MFCPDHGPFIQMLRSWQIIYLTLNKRSSRMRVTSALFLKVSLFFLERKCTLREWNKTRSVCLWWMCVIWRLHFAHKLFFFVFCFFSWIFSKCVFCFIWMCFFFCSIRLRKVMFTVAFTFFTKLISLMLWKTALFLGSVHVHYRDGKKIKYLFKF